MGWKDGLYLITGVLIAILIYSVYYFSNKTGYIIFDLGLLIVLIIIGASIGFGYKRFKDKKVKRFKNKNKFYLVKGATLGVIISAIIFSILYIYCVYFGDFCYFLIFPSIIGVALSIPVGALIGWIYGKIKSKK